MSVYITVLWSPGVEPGEQAQELAVVVAVLELVAAVVVVVVVAVAAACTAAVSRPQERPCCWWRCVEGLRRRQHRPGSSPALATCFLHVEPGGSVLNVDGGGI